MDSDDYMSCSDEMDPYGWSGDEYEEYGPERWANAGESGDSECEDFDEDYDDDEDEDDDEEDDLLRRRGPPPTPLAPPPPVLCRFFVLGKCRYGSRCTFSHTLPNAADGDSVDQETMAAMVDCPFFQRGNCKYGQYCRLRHALPATAASTRARGDNQRGHQYAAGPPPAAGECTTAAQPANGDSNQHEYTCGICFEDIVEAGKHFGLLSCDHCFCLDCLRSWRQSKDMEVEVTRSCPACRLPSNYIVPSLKFCVGDEKNAVVDAYKRHLAIRECKYFDGAFGSCPFGANCFYAHRNASGDDVKHFDRARRSRRRRQSSDSSESLLSSSFGGSSRGGREARRPYPDALSSILDRYNEFFRFLESFEWEDDDPRR